MEFVSVITSDKMIGTPLGFQLVDKESPYFMRGGTMEAFSHRASFRMYIQAICHPIPATKMP